MCDAFLVLAQAPGGLSCFLMPRFLPDGSVNALRLPAAQGQARQPLECLLGGGVPGRARLADRRGGPRRPDHHRDGDVHAARLRGRLRRPDAAGACQRHPSLPASQRVPEASRRPAADDAGAGRSGARRGGGDGAVVPPVAQLRPGLGPARRGLAPADDAGHQVLGVQDRASARLRGDGVPRRQRLRRGGVWPRASIASCRSTPSGRAPATSWRSTCCACCSASPSRSRSSWTISPPP